MKNLICRLAILAIALFFGSVNAQTINWAGLKEENKHLINANLGWDYGVIYGLGYGYQFKIWVFPAIGNIEYSTPSGENKLDDFKARSDWLSLIIFNSVPKFMAFSAGTKAKWSVLLISVAICQLWPDIIAKSGSLQPKVVLTNLL
jgi:hypothetical protein